MSILIELPQAQSEKLSAEAQRLGVEPRELARALVIDVLNREAADFRAAAAARAAQERRALSPPRLMRYLSLSEVIELHRLVISTSGGFHGVRDFGGLESAVAQPRMSFGGEDLYPTLVEKAAALCFSLVSNHAFLDGNKRVGHAAMESYLVMNGLRIEAAVGEQEKVILALAAGELERQSLVEWLSQHVVAMTG